ncbi:MAG: hypothetical protein ABL959_12480 [Pyrinomonadaceae bacterium]
MKAQEYLMICVAEECAEIQQRITKALRFGLYEIQPGQPDNNLVRIREEFNDLLGVLELVASHGTALMVIDRKQVDAKIDKVIKFMEYSEDLGLLEATD